MRNTDKVDAVILLSHNGMDVDLKLASRVTGIDVILGGHTHDAVPQPIAVTNAGGVTLVTNAGSNGKFLARARSRHRQGQGRQRALPAAAGVLRIAEARSGDAGADRQDPRAACGRTATKRSRPPTACSTAAAISAARMDQLICDALLGELERRDRAVAGLSLGHHRAGGPAADDGGRAGADRRHLSRDLRPDHDRRPDQGRAGRRLRQSLQRRSLLPAGRRHGPRRRPRLHLHAERDRRASGFPNSSSTTAMRCRPARATRWRAGPPSTSRAARRSGMWSPSICGRASRPTGRRRASR